MNSLIIPLSFLIPLMLLLLNYIIFKKKFFSRYKPSSFECGFDAKSPAHISFSVKFYLISIIFLIFDIEITLLLPAPFMLLNSTNPASILFYVFFLVFILIKGLFIEWKEGALHWLN